MSHFGLSCVLIVYYLCKYTEFHVMRTECQMIIFHFLLFISHKSLACAKRYHLPYLI